MGAFWTGADRVTLLQVFEGSEPDMWATFMGVHIIWREKGYLVPLSQCEILELE